MCVCACARMLLLLLGGSVVESSNSLLEERVNR